MQKKLKQKKQPYITIYSKLTTQEQKAIKYKRLFKSQHPEWDDSLVKLSYLFNQNTNSNLQILDAGCGNGNYVIDENKYKIKRSIGVDLDKTIININKSVDEIVFSDLAKLPFEDDQFDAIVSLWVLEHIDKPKQVIKELNRILKPKGKFFFVAPNKNYFLIKIKTSIDVISTALSDKITGFL